MSVDFDIEHDTSFDIDIEPETIAQVMDITGADTLNEAVETALRQMIARIEAGLERVRD